VLVLGVTYKPDVEDLRESPALEIMKSLRAAGAKVEYHDPHASEVWIGDHVLHSVDPATAKADLVVVHTRHRGMDLGWLSEDQLVLDTTYRLSGPIRRVVL
jgi:UDP-N-acetyl-D-glucosamine dehydrogenase